jgi:hypothetical protein
MLEIPAVACVLALNWIGLRMVWEAAGIHETSRFRDVVEKAMERESAVESLGWPVRRWFYYSLWALAVIVTLAGFFSELAEVANESVLVLNIVCLLATVTSAWLFGWAVRLAPRWFPLACLPTLQAGSIIAVAFLVHPQLLFHICFVVALTWSGWLLCKDPAGRSQWFTPRMWKDIARGTAVFAALVALFYVVENARGRREWDRTKAELAAKGVNLEWSHFIPAPLPADQNIFGVPKMQEWFTGWGENEFSRIMKASLGPAWFLRSERLLIDRDPAAVSAYERLLTNRDPAAISAYLAASGELEPEMALIRQALQRPFARIEGDYGAPVHMPVPNWLNLRAMGLMLSARTHCHLLRGESQAALADLTLLHDLRRLVEGPPGGLPETIPESMTDCTLAGLYAYSIGEGAQGHYWTDPQLEILQNQLKEIDLPTVALKTMESIQAEEVEEIDKLARTQIASHFAYGYSGINYQLLLQLAPRGWIDQNMSFLARYDQRVIDVFRDENNTLHPETLPADPPNYPSPYQVISLSMIPNYPRYASSIAHNQTEVFQALIACALERYRLAHGQYPASLQELVPACLDRIPNDPIGGQPPVYQLGKDGAFQLSSAGFLMDWRYTTTAREIDKGRWVWPPELVKSNL